MPTPKSYIRCAELFWKLDFCEMEYRCVSCRNRFSSHSDCVNHIQDCFQLKLDPAIEELISEDVEFADEMPDIKQEGI